MQEQEARQTKNVEPLQEQKQQSLYGMKLRWCLGLNYELSEGVLNVSTNKKNEICYTSGHMIIIYDYEKRRQRILQGHANKISAIAFNQKQQTLVSADEGTTSMLIVWHFESGCPVRTIFDPEVCGIISLDLSNDGNKILTLGKSCNGEQRVRIWAWKDFTKSLPIEAEGVFRFDPFTYTMGKDPFRHIKFNQSDLTEFVTTGVSEIRFWRVDKACCSEYNPTSVSKKNYLNDQKQEYGQTVFLPEEGNTVAVTGTEEGSLIVWDIILIMEEEGNLNNRREVKSINLFGKLGMKNPSVSIITIYENFLVIGTSAGTVRFYDFRFRIICWFEDLSLARITSISFSSSKNSDAPLKVYNIEGSPNGLDRTSKKSNEDSANALQSHYRGSELTVSNSQAKDKNFFDNSENRNYKAPNNMYTLPDEEEELNFPEFIVCDTEARVHLLNKQLFYQIDVNKRKGKLILQALDKSVLCMAFAPNKPKLCLACSNSKVCEWTLYSPTLTVIKNFKEEGHSNEIPTCLDYSPNGDYLVVGTSQGNVYIKHTASSQFNSTPLLISQKKKGVKCEKIAFAPNSMYFAISDDIKCVSIFKLGHKYDDSSQPIEWVFASKIRAHTARITDLCFSSDSTKVFSISEDMYLAQYNIQKISEPNFIDVFYKIEAEDIPTSCVYYPFEDNEDLLLISNAGYKLKLWNVVTDERICRMTALGPTFGGPISFMKILNHVDPAQLADANGLATNHDNAFATEKIIISGDNRSENPANDTVQVSKAEVLPKKSLSNSSPYKRATYSPSNIRNQSRESKIDITNSEALKSSFDDRQRPKKERDSFFKNKEESTNKENLSTIVKVNLNGANSQNELKKQNLVGSSKFNNIDFPATSNNYLSKADQLAGKEKKGYLVFATSEKIIGIIKLPLNGNSNNCLGLIAHSGGINHMEVSKNGNYVFTAGDGDISLNVWQVDYKTLESSPVLNMPISNVLDIYPNLLEGGEQGQLYRDLKDFFYYCQIRRKEENTTKAHKLDGKIPIGELSDLMIALGYYPTNQEISNMKNEVKFSRVHEEIEVNELSLKEFVKLFINHRPAYGLSKDYIEGMWKQVFPAKDVSRKEFLDLLTNNGEKMRMDDIEYNLNILLGDGKAGDLLPERIDTDFLIEKILGFETLESLQDNFDKAA